jgi:L-alanine-DL-glutamate epimerase-like enolase superfamily enzyme
MSRIDRVEIHAFTYDVPNLGLPAHGAQGVGNWVYQKGSKVKASRYAVRIRTDDGLAGEYVTHWVGTPSAMAQSLMLAPHLLGRDPESREQIYDDLKRELRAYDHMGHGPLDIALWDLAGKKYGAPVARLLGGFRTRLPTYASTFTARTSRAASMALKRSPTSPSIAGRSATPASRSTAGTTATAGARRKTCWACARGSATTWR